jgi:hypothetical protein
MFLRVTLAAYGMSLGCLSAAAVPAELERFVGEHCYECHDADVKKAGLDLTSAEWTLDKRALFDLWVKVHDKVEKGEMPPKKQTQPSADAKKQFLTALKTPLHDTSLAAQAKTGRTLSRRLNRAEYENTVHDLLKIDIPLAGYLPEDQPMHGFDTVAEGLRFSQLQLETYLVAADVALDHAIDLRVTPECKTQRYFYKDEQSIIENLALPDNPPEDPKKKYNRKRQVFRNIPDATVLFSDPDYMLGVRKFSPKRSGTYRFRISAYGYQSDGEPVTLRLYANNYQLGRRLLGTWDMPADKPREVEVTARFNRNEQLMVLPFRVGFDKDGQRLNDADTTKQFKGRGLAVQWIEIEGPLEGKQSPMPSLTALFDGVPLQVIPEKEIKNRWDLENAIGFKLAPTDPAAALRAVVEKFATRAFRRPLESGEADGFVKLGDTALSTGKDFVTAAKVSLRAILSCPQFLLFDEAPGTRLSDHALAARLSYFLWSTLPDAELNKLAADNRLHESSVLQAQVKRLIADPRHRQFVKNFTGQWLDLRAIEATTPDPSLYPEYDEMLKLGMVGETEAFFEEVLQKDLPVTHFIQSDFITINSRLARHYRLGEDIARDEKFIRVSVPAGHERGGVLTQASVLKVTANGTVSSPVLRGAWVMKRLLGDPPSPPPPGISGVEPDTRGASTIRELLAKHRDSETCASCHSKMDPPGFALESFDVIGGLRTRYRSKDHGERPSDKVDNRGVWQYKVNLPVDATGELPDGSKFTNIQEFKALLLKQPQAIQRCLAEKLLTYATGAPPSFADREAVSNILKAAATNDCGLKNLITQVILSPVFQSK